MTEKAITIQDLTKQFDEKKAVDSLNLEVAKGELFGLLGPNGAGKTTTINILCGLVKPTSGLVEVYGYNVQTETSKVKELIGVCTQETAIYPYLTGAENLELFGNLHCMDRKTLKKKSKMLLESMGLKDDAKRVTAKYSGGMKRRLSLTLALIHDPQVVFLDEPTVGFDIQTRLRMWGYLRDIKRQGTTIFLTTHYMEEADQLSDRISIIDHGKIITTGTGTELKNQIGKDIIYLETGDNKAAASILRTLESVKGVNEDTEFLRIMIGVDATHILPKIMDMMRQNGIEITAVNIKKPSMDDVFVHYTGHGLREGGPDETKNESETEEAAK